MKNQENSCHTNPSTKTIWRYETVVKLCNGHHIDECYSCNKCNKKRHNTNFCRNPPPTTTNQSTNVGTNTGISIRRIKTCYRCNEICHFSRNFTKLMNQEVKLKTDQPWLELVIKSHNYLQRLVYFSLNHSYNKVRLIQIHIEILWTLNIIQILNHIFSRLEKTNRVWITSVVWESYLQNCNNLYFNT